MIVATFRLTALALVLIAHEAVGACSIDGRPLAFGDVETTRRTLGVGEIRVSCDEPGGFEIGIAGGSERELRGPDGATLTYELHQDPGRSIVWGDGGASGSTRSGTTDDRGEAEIPVYGVIPPQPGAPPGSYDDQLQITIIF